MCPERANMIRHPSSGLDSVKRITSQLIPEAAYQHLWVNQRKFPTSGVGKELCTQFQT